jgi:hypothetical protein
MAAQRITNHAKKQIAAQGGPIVIVERMRAGETLAEIARTIFRPDGRAISKRLLDGIMGKHPGMRAAMAKAKRDFRAIPEWPRRKRRKAIRASEQERVVRAKLVHDGFVHGGPAIETESQRTYMAHMASLATERRNPYAKPPAPRPAPPRPAPPPRPPEPPQRRTDVEWDEARPWCHACERGNCMHVKREVMRRAQARLDADRANAPRIIRGIV